MSLMHERASYDAKVVYRGPATAFSHTAEAIRVVVIDAHTLVREALRAFIGLHSEMSVVAAAHSIAEGVEAARFAQPDLVLMDAGLTEVRGPKAVALFRQHHPDVPLLMLSSAEGDKIIEGCLAAGATGYLLKSSPSDVVAAGIRAVARGQKFLSPELSVLLARSARSPGLSAREIEVLSQARQGHANTEIARLLGISHKTVKNHLTHIFTKLRARDRTHAVTIAMQRGMIEMP